MGERKASSDGFIAGSVGGALSVATTHPLDTIKVRLQLFPEYKGVFDCTRKILKQEGVRSFYRGMAFPLVTSSVYNSLVFGSYHFYLKTICKWRYNDPHHRPALSDQIVSSMATGASTVVIGAPVDLIKIRLQMQTDPVKSKIKEIRPLASPSPQRQAYTGPFNCAMVTYRESGFKGLYRGAFVMLIRDIPGYTIYLVPYFILRDRLAKKNRNDNLFLALIFSAIAGGCAGVLSWGGIHPLDTVKTRLQADAMNSNQKYKGIIQCVQSIYRQNGISAFFRGITVSALRGFPQSAVLYVGVETTHRVLDQVK